MSAVIVLAVAAITLWWYPGPQAHERKAGLNRRPIRRATWERTG
jgi:hypothetical protein